MVYMTFALADLFEGDLKLPQSEIDRIKNSTISKKDAVSAATKKWPKNIVPYVIDKNVGMFLFLF